MKTIEEHRLNEIRGGDDGTASTGWLPPPPGYDTCPDFLSPLFDWRNVDDNPLAD